LARHAGIVVIAGGHGVAMIMRSPNFVIIAGSLARRQCRWSGSPYTSSAMTACSHARLKRPTLSLAWDHALPRVQDRPTGAPLKIALAWRAAGFIVPDAALLIQDGWILEAAVKCPA
jgi:hypothetical protein